MYKTLTAEWHSWRRFFIIIVVIVFHWFFMEGIVVEKILLVISCLDNNCRLFLLFVTAWRRAGPWCKGPQAVSSRASPPSPPSARPGKVRVKIGIGPKISLKAGIKVRAILRMKGKTLLRGTLSTQTNGESENSRLFKKKPDGKTCEEFYLNAQHVCLVVMLVAVQHVRPTGDMGRQAGGRVDGRAAA